MHFLDQIRRIERIDYLIRSKATGSPDDLAETLCISESQLFEIIKFMKEEMGAPIFYCKEDQSYCYHTSVKFICTLKYIDNT
jgi:hypothetical protein